MSHLDTFAFKQHMLSNVKETSCHSQTLQLQHRSNLGHPNAMHNLLTSCVPLKSEAFYTTHMHTLALRSKDSSRLVISKKRGGISVKSRQALLSSCNNGYYAQCFQLKTVHHPHAFLLLTSIIQDETTEIRMRVILSTARFLAARP